MPILTILGHYHNTALCLLAHESTYTTVIRCLARMAPYVFGLPIFGEEFWYIVKMLSTEANVVAEFAICNILRSNYMTQVFGLLLFQLF